MKKRREPRRVLRRVTETTIYGPPCDPAPEGASPAVAALSAMAGAEGAEHDAEPALEEVVPGCGCMVRRTVTEEFLGDDEIDTDEDEAESRS